MYVIECVDDIYCRSYHLLMLFDCIDSIPFVFGTKENHS